MKKVSVDVTYNQLKNPDSHPFLKEVLDTLYKSWVYPNDERADSVRIGTIDVYIGEDGNVKIDFTTRFAINEN